MTKIQILKNPNGDTRTAPDNITFKQFQEANDSHIDDVYSVMTVLSNELYNQALKHDYTKKSDEEQFFEDFLKTKKEGANFVELPWYQKHIKEERHHPNSYCHEDINLLDIIETIVDCVCAGKARSGEVRQLEFDDEKYDPEYEKNRFNFRPSWSEVVDCRKACEGYRRKCHTDQAVYTPFQPCTGTDG